MELKKLPKEVSSLLRTGVTITSSSQCVAELVTNALDAGATSIAVRIDFRTFKLQVIDNGFGISKKNLDVIGKRYMTSKCHSLTELEGQLDKFGFRGESIASLREVSGLLNVTSRAHGSSSTYSKVFAHGKSTSVGLTADQRPSHGTTITVQDFLYNMPVRRKRIKESVDFEEMKTQLESLALVHPQVSFSLRNDASGKLVLQTRKCQNTVEAFKNLFGLKVASCLRPVEFSEGNIEISGFIGKEVYHQKTLQFLYINNRLVVKTKLHKLIHMILAKSFLLKAPGPWLNLPIPKDMNERFGMPMPKKSKHPMFVINLKCPYTEYDITLDPRKSLVQFKNSDRVLNCLEEAVKLFLQRENLTVVSPETSCDKAAAEPSLLDEMEQLDKEDVLSGGEPEETSSHKRKHRPSPQLHITRAVHGLPAKRHKTTICENPKKVLTPPELDVQQDSDCVEMATLSSDDFASPSPKIRNTVTKTKHHKQNLLSSSDSAGDSDSPVDTWAKYKARTAAAKNAKAQKKPRTGDKEQEVLPASLGKLRIYSLAANTLRKTFAHLNEREQTAVDKPDTKFPVCHGEPQLEDSFITPQKKAVTATDQDQDILGVTPAAPHVKANVSEASQFNQNQISTHHYKNKENISTSHIHNLPSDSSHDQVINSDHSHQQNQQPQYYHNLQNMTTIPDNNQYNEVLQIQNIPSYNMGESRKCLNTTVSEKCYQNPSCCDGGGRLYRPELTDGVSTDRTDGVAQNRNYELYTANTLSSDTTRYQEVEYSESHYDKADKLQEAITFMSSHKNIKQKLNFLSPLSSSVEHIESPQTFNSFNDNALSSDSMSEEQYERMEARLREPLEQISREINKTRHSMLLSTSPTLSKSPEFLSPDLNLPQPQVGSNYDQPSTSDLKFSRLSSFLYDKRSKAHYRPSSHIKEVPDTSSICDIQHQDESRAPVDTPFTKLTKHISEIEKLTERKLSVCDSFNIPVESTSEEQINERQRLAGLDDICVVERTTCSSHKFQQFHLKCVGSTAHAQDVPAEMYEDPLSTSAVLNQLGPLSESVSSLQDEGLLSAVAVLQQLNTTETTVQDCELFDQNMPATAKEVLLQLGAPPINEEAPVSKVLCSEDLLLSSSAVLKQLSPRGANIMPEDTSENILSSTAVLQKLAPPPFTGFFDSSLNTTNESCYPMTPEVDTNCLELTESCMMRQETPDMPEHHRLVPYSGSSSSDDMECNVSKPEWRSIVDAPDDTVSGSNDTFLSVLSSKQHLLTETPFLPVECFANTPQVSESLKSMLLERTQISFEDFINKSQEIGSNEEFYVSPTTINVAVLSKSDKVNQCENMEVEIEDSILNSAIENCDTNSGNVIKSNISPKLEEAKVWEEREDPSGRKYYVNMKSGITSYEAPVRSTEQFGFSMTPRLAFMPKGSSPVLKLACDKQLNAVPLNEQEQQQLQADVTNCLEDNLDTIKWNKQQTKASGFEQLVQKLLSENENRVHEKSISNACEHGGALVKIHNSLNQYKFSKDMLTSFKVLGQWDDKFVLTAVSMQSDQQPHLLVLFDQHAVHERVRLERLTRGYQSTSGMEGQFHGEEIHPALLLELSEREVRVMSSFAEQFTRLGLQFSAVSDTCVRVTQVPTSFKLRDERQRGSRGRSLEDLVTSLVREQAHSVLHTRGVGARVPPTLQAVLNSEACTGAIKFGDPLSDKECIMLLACLSSCEMPFQCAHGRPVLAPIADFKHLQQARTKVQKPRLAGLLEKLSAAME